MSSLKVFRTLSWSVALGLFLFTACDLFTPTEPVIPGQSGSAEVSVKVGRVGALAKGQAIEPNDLTNTFLSSGRRAKKMKIYVDNMPFSMSEDDIRDLFEGLGPVDAVSIVTDRETGRRWGFALVEMGDDNAARSAMEALDKKMAGGRTLKVNEARLRQNGGGGGLDLDYYDLFGIVELPDWIEGFGTFESASFDDGSLTPMKVRAKVDSVSDLISIKIKR